MKHWQKIIIITAGVLLGTSVFASPASNLLRNSLPETDITYDLGTTTNRWLHTWTQNASTTNMTVSGALSGMSGSPNTLAFWSASSTLTSTSSSPLLVSSLFATSSTATSTIPNLFSNNSTTTNATTTNTTITGTASTSRLRVSGLIDSIFDSGNVGIGSTTPASLLGVGGAGMFAGNITIAGSAVTGMNIDDSVAASGNQLVLAIKTPINTAGYISFVENGVNKWRIYNDYAQTTEDLLTFTFAGTNKDFTINSSGNATVRGTLTVSGASATIPVVIGGTAVGSSLALQSTSGVGTTDFIKFTTGNNGATEAMRINTSGNVGIGTTTPLSALAVIYSDANTTHNSVAFPVITNKSNTSGAFAGLQFNGTTNTGGIYPAGTLSYTYTPGAAILQSTFHLRIVDTAGNYNEALTVTPNSGSANVGIGTTTPLSILNVLYSDSNTAHNSVAFPRIINSSNTSGAFSGLRFDGTTNTGGLYPAGTLSYDYTPGAAILQSKFHLRIVDTNGSYNEALTVTPNAGSANVGIGTTSPYRALSNVGGFVSTNLDAFATGDSAVCYRGTTNGLVTFDSGVSSCIVSTRKAKHDILTISNDYLTRIMALQPVSFIYNGTDKSDIGLIAEDVAEIDKRYAQFNNQGEPRAINWSAITADLVKMVQTQQGQIQNLQQQILLQQKQIDLLNIPKK